MNTRYPIHDLDSAPAGSRPALEATAARLGKIPNLVGTMAAVPQLINSFLQLTQTAETLTLPALEREIVALVAGVEIGCRHCIAMHTGALKRLGAPQSVIAAIRAGRPLDDLRLAALLDFTRQVIAERGAVGDDTQSAFFAVGFTDVQALEIVFLVSVLSMSMYSSRLAHVPLDDALKALAS
ncbi:MAG TPA: carboxymuconolactone decarboxylase family protein [Thermoanaerobaculia bacterium]|nr:carboxymuconolactone decarboxylase family protein [Thermoanaerobaculia bacterium]